MDLAIGGVRSLIRTKGADDRSVVLVESLVGCSSLRRRTQLHQTVVIDRKLGEQVSLKKEVETNACERRRNIIDVRAQQLNRAAAHIRERGIRCGAENVIG